MSSAATETTDKPTTLPSLTIFSRVASIPLVSSSLETIDQTLSSNAYTRSSYSTAKELSLTAYKYTGPIQNHLAPLITRADDIANKAVDVVESRYPYPFKAKPEEVTEYVRERGHTASEYVQHSLDEKIKTPAVNVATGIDHRFAPIVNYFEVAINRIMNPNEPGPSSPDTKYQYQRALALTRTLYGYSNEQIKQLQAHSTVLQRATETAHSISALATSSFINAQSRVHQLSDTMITELQSLQSATVSLSSSLQSTATNTVQNSTNQIQSRIPPQIQEGFAELSNNLSTTVHDLSNMLVEKDVPFQEKLMKFRGEVSDRVVPLLTNVAKVVGDALHLNSVPVTPSQSPEECPMEEKEKEKGKELEESTTSTSTEESEVQEKREQESESESSDGLVVETK